MFMLCNASTSSVGLGTTKSASLVYKMQELEVLFKVLIALGMERVYGCVCDAMVYTFVSETSAGDGVIM